MFGSYLVELVIGLSFLFAVLGIVTSAISEAALSVMKVRAKHLKEWLAQWSAQLAGSAGGSAAPLAGSAGASMAPLPTIAHLPFSLSALRSHPLVASQNRGSDTPSYLPADHLAGAVLQILAMPIGSGCIGQELKAAEGALRTHIASLQSEPLKSAFNALLNTAASKAIDGSSLAEALSVETEKWINASMDRVEGWTKRYAKKISLVVAMVVCLAFNVSALEVLRVLSSDAPLRTQIASTAASYVAVSCGAATSSQPANGAASAGAANAAGQTRATPAKPTDEEAVATVDCLRERSANAVAALGPLSRLGIGWDNPPRFVSAAGAVAVGEFVIWLIGVACAAFAASLGGDFWFKWIGDIVRLTGYKPARKEESQPEPAKLGLLDRIAMRR